MKVEFTHETVFSFEGPNLCLLGNENDFRKLAESVLDLTDNTRSVSIDVISLPFIQNDGEHKRIMFSSQKQGRQLGTFNDKGELIFQLDSNYWERLFKFFVLMSWDKRTYYLNFYENHLSDLELEQECNFICSSAF